MKKLMSVLAVVFFFLLTTIFTVKAQPADVLHGYQHTEIYSMPAGYPVFKDSSDVVVINDDADLKAAKMKLRESKASFKQLKAGFRCSASFRKEFEHIPEPTWYFGKEVIFGSFKKDGITTRIDYTKNGRWLHTLNYFPPAATPANVRKIIQADYPNTTINLTIGIWEGNKNFCIVELQDDKTYKQVAIDNDNTTLIHEYQKAF